MKIVCFHIYNNYSGSPKVLALVIQGLLDKGYEVDLITSLSHGALDNLRGKIRQYRYRYNFSNNKLLAAIYFIYAQIYTFLFAFKYIFKSDSVFYINTIMPAMAAIAGKIIGKKIVYHYHEHAPAKGLLYRILCNFMELLASRIICVSEFQKSYLRRKKDVYVIPNALSHDFIDRLSPNIHEAFKRRTVLMLSSLSIHKGLCQFFSLARNLPQYQFNLVISDNINNINKFITTNKLSVPDNCHIYDRQPDTVYFYNNASIVVNLSLKEMVIETFGLTALEAMSAGLPVIVPTVGGIAEMVEDNYNGYKIDSTLLPVIEEKINLVMNDQNLYSRLANNALLKSKEYNIDSMVNGIGNILCK